MGSLPGFKSLPSARLDRRRFLTVNPSCALFCDLLPSPGTGARPERVGQAIVFASDQKLGALMSHGSNPKRSLMGVLVLARQWHEADSPMPSTNVRLGNIART